VSFKCYGIYVKTTVRRAGYKNALCPPHTAHLAPTFHSFTPPQSMVAEMSKSSHTGISQVVSKLMRASCTFDAHTPSSAALRLFAKGVRVVPVLSQGSLAGILSQVWSATHYASIPLRILHVGDPHGVLRRVCTARVQDKTEQLPHPLIADIPPL
jgi:hypothetical protein